MSSEQNSESERQQLQPTTLGTLNPARREFWKSLKDRLWGYDFFISYHWASGGAYAVNLAQRLREKNYDVFLDRADYASGDNWKSVGERALRNTQRLVIIATREAVTASEPVELEVRLFTARGRQVISIVFGDRFEELNRSEYPTLNLMSESQLYIEENKESLGSDPSERVVAELIRTHAVMCRRSLRAMLMLIPVIAVILFAAFATGSWINANMARQTAERQSRLSDALRLVSESKIFLESDPRLSALLAVESINVLRPDNTRLTASINALRHSIAQIGGQTLISNESSQLDIVRSMTLSPERHWIAMPVGESVSLAHLDSAFRLPVQLRLLPGHASNAQTLSFSPADRWLISATGSSSALMTTSEDHRLGLWKLDERNAHSLAPLTGHSGAVNSVAFSLNGAWMVSVSDDGTALRWRVAAEEIDPTPLTLATLGVPLLVVAITPDSKYAAVGTHAGGLCLLNLESPSSAPVNFQIPSFLQIADITELIISPDGRWLCAGSLNWGAGGSDILVWDLKKSGFSSEKPIVLKGNKRSLRALEISPDSHWLASAGEDNIARLWDLRRVEFSDADFLLYGYDVAVFEVPMAVLLPHDKYFMSSIAFSPTSRWLVTGCDGAVHQDYRVRIWDLTAPDPAFDPIELRGHQKPVKSVAFVDEHCVITGGEDGIVLWNLREDDLLSVAELMVKRNFTQEEWKEHFNLQDYRQTFSGLSGR